MEALDQELEDTLNDGSEKHIIVPHAAFGYWDKYGIEQIPITGYTMTDEPSQRQLAGLIDTVREYDLEYVLYEQNNTNNISEVIQNEIGAEAEMIHNMEVRTEEDINNDADYISLMQYNLDVLEKVTE
ncbi:metal ABC transporter solute-binding protein, Zn/Mn family [Salinicoccus kekensis]|uniref:metal ABC transporter solute-binding protein, Zn/Mn family n=1 Tax=Salinicoccus kekensis TaxID=714307 RepID=UPI000BE46A71|nr:zinc ABC transporter substrate-binding protein [Salinicoccus kekensis]